MARKTQKFDFDIKGEDGEIDNTFEIKVTQMSPSKSLKFLAWVGSLIGGSAGEALNLLKGKSLNDISDEDISAEKIGTVISGLLEKLDDDRTIEKLNLLLSSAKCEGVELEVDHFIFEEDLALLPKVIKACFEVNYKRFLVGGSGVMKKIKETMVVLKDSKKDDESTGISIV